MSSTTTAAILAGLRPRFPSSAGGEAALSPWIPSSIQTSYVLQRGRHDDPSHAPTSRRAARPQRALARLLTAREHVPRGLGSRRPDHRRYGLGARGALFRYCAALRARPFRAAARGRARIASTRLLRCLLEGRATARTRRSP